MTPTHEVIFIGLPGPTHHYGGLSADNVASSLNRGSVSSPKEAALQVLALAGNLRGLGMKVGILPPQLRPYLPLLHEQFSGSDEEVIARAGAQTPELLEQASSSSAMWVANAATVTAQVDANKLHLTAANLHSNLHRRIEAQDTYRILSAIFSGIPDCVVHAPLADALPDEGAANHMRLCPNHSAPALNVFVYGQGGSSRQSLAASQAVVAQHGLPKERTLFIQQNPAVIAGGVFHNDVIAVSNKNVLLVHELAYANGMDDIVAIEAAYKKHYPTQPFHSIVITESELSLKELVDTYFFNSQIVSTPQGMAIIAPTEAKQLYDGKAAAVLERIVADVSNPIAAIHYLELRQSMRNGGGPACLRLRVPMTDAQYIALQASRRVLADDPLIAGIAALIGAYYPAQLTPADLANPALYHQCHRLLEELGALMGVALLK